MTPNELDELVQELSNVETIEEIERPPAAVLMAVRGADD